MSFFKSSAALFVLASALLAAPSSAAPTGAAGCAGNGSVGGPHLPPTGSPGEALADQGFVVLLGIDTTVDDSIDNLFPVVDVTLPYALPADVPIEFRLIQQNPAVFEEFRGFLFRLVNTNGDPTDGSFDIPDELVSISKLATPCSDIGLAGVTHVNNDPKSVVSAFAILEPGTYELEVTAVVKNGLDTSTGQHQSTWSYLTIPIVAGGDVSDCSICPPGSVMQSPDNPIPLLPDSPTCGEVDAAIQSDPDFCSSISNNPLVEIVDFAAWCGCSGSPPPNFCDPCFEGQVVVNPDTEVTTPPPFGITLTCAEAEVFVDYIKQDSYCPLVAGVFAPPCCAAATTTTTTTTTVSTSTGGVTATSTGGFFTTGGFPVTTTSGGVTTGGFPVTTTSGGVTSTTTGGGVTSTTTGGGVTSTTTGSVTSTATASSGGVTDTTGVLGGGPGPTSSMASVPAYVSGVAVASVAWNFIVTYLL